jgi:hydrogenase maturation protease
MNILGIGNPLMGDDGVGPAAVERLKARGVPEGVHLWDAGLAVTDVLGMLDPADPLTVIDAARAGGRPGEIHRLRLDVLDLGASDAGGMLSLHELSVVPSLQMEALAGRRFGKVTVFGIEPAACEWGEGLSAPVADALEHVVDEVLSYASTERAAVEPAAAAAGHVPDLGTSRAARQE